MLQRLTRFISKDNIQIGIHVPPVFATPADEYEYYKIYWADEKTKYLYATAHHVLNFPDDSIAFKKSERLWVLVETDVISDLLKFSPKQKLIMPLIMERKLVYEITDFFDDKGGSVSTNISRMNDKIGIYSKGSAITLLEYFLDRIHCNIS